MDCGAPCVMMNGMGEMLVLSADNWDIMDVIGSHYCITITFIVYSFSIISSEKT